MNKLINYFLAFVISMAFVSCDTDSAASLIGETYECYTIELDAWADNRPIETTERITFQSGGMCSVYRYGYEWIYRSGKYTQNHWTDDRSLPYTVNGSLVTIKGYIRVNGGDNRDLVLRINVGSLVEEHGERTFIRM